VNAAVAMTALAAGSSARASNILSISFSEYAAVVDVSAPSGTGRVRHRITLKRIHLLCVIEYGNKKPFAVLQ
jgi:hypothetical protein